ncbi:12995_t:CDS:1, partial [Racocetra persica]
FWELDGLDANSSLTTLDGLLYNRGMVVKKPSSLRAQGELSSQPNEYTYNNILQ